MGVGGSFWYIKTIDALIVFVLLLGLSTCTTGCTETPQLVPEKPSPVLVTKVEPFTIEMKPEDTAPAGAKKYQRTLTSAAHQIWGLDAPIPAMAAQVHQESGWNENAKSPVGAQGLGQFMPATAADVGKSDPELREVQPYNPAWALRALVRYNYTLYNQIKNADSECDHIAFMDSAYNGGLLWVFRDQKLAASKGLDATRYWGSVETINAGRSVSAWNENRGYPKRIIRVLQPKYITWGKPSCSAT